MSKKMVSVNGFGDRYEWEELTRISSSCGMGCSYQEAGEYLVLRRELPKPKEEECPEWKAGDLLICDDPIFDRKKSYMIDESLAPREVYGCVSRNSMCFGRTYRFNREIYRNGKKIWWKGKVEGQEHEHF